jgi:cell division initiation protein
MKLTPLDIHHKEFRHSLRGYAEDEVDQFLDEVADEFERLFKENIDLSERLEAAAARVRELEMKESVVNNAIIETPRSRPKRSSTTPFRESSR